MRKNLVFFTVHFTLFDEKSPDYSQNLDGPLFSLTLLSSFFQKTRERQRPFGGCQVMADDPADVSEDENERCSEGVKTCGGEGDAAAPGSKLCEQCCCKFFEADPEFSNYTKAMCLVRAHIGGYIILKQDGTPIKDWTSIKLEAASDKALQKVGHLLPKETDAGDAPPLACQQAQHASHTCVYLSRTACVSPSSRIPSPTLVPQSHPSPPHLPSTPPINQSPPPPSNSQCEVPQEQAG